MIPDNRSASCLGRASFSEDGVEFSSLISWEDGTSTGDEGNGETRASGNS